MATEILKAAQNETTSKNVGDFDRNRMEIALASKSTLIPHNLGVNGIIAFITNSHQKNLVR